MRWVVFPSAVLLAVAPTFAADLRGRPDTALRTPAPAPGFLEAYLAPELARQTEAFSSYVGSPAYGVHREADSNCHLETVAGIERNTIRAVRRATRDWLVEATGAERFTLTLRPFSEAGARIPSGNARGDTQIRLGLSRLYPRVVVERPTSAGAFRFAASLDGRAEADFRPDSRYAPAVGAEWDTRDRTARFRLGLAF